MGEQEISCPENLLGYSFKIKVKVGRGRKFSLSSQEDIMLSTSAPPPDRGGEFSCPYMVMLGPQITGFFGV